MRRLARAYRKTTGKKLKWWLVTASVSTEDGAAGAPAPPRGHRMPMDWELTRPALAAGGVFIPTPGCDRGLYRRGQVHDTQRRVRRSASLVPLSGYPAAPIFHAHPCGQSGHGAGAAGGRVVEREIREDGETGFSAAYIRWVMPLKSNAVRHGRRRRT